MRDKIKKARDITVLVLNLLCGPSKRFCRYLYSHLCFLIKQRKDLDKTERNIISLLAPTRGRPRWALRLVLSACRTSVFPGRVEILFYIDSNDEKKEEYLTLFKKKSKAFKKLKRCELFIGEPICISKSWEILAKKCEGELIQLASDDAVYVDYGWDCVLDKEARKFPDRIFCTWFSDGGRCSQFPSFPIVSRRWVEIVGYFSRGITGFGYVDTWIYDIARKIGRLHYIDSIVMEHVHHGYKKAIIDETYRRRFHVLTDEDKIFYSSSAEDIRKRDAEKLMQAIADYGKKG